MGELLTSNRYPGIHVVPRAAGQTRPEFPMTHLRCALTRKQGSSNAFIRPKVSRMNGDFFHPINKMGPSPARGNA